MKKKKIKESVQLVLPGSPKVVIDYPALNIMYCKADINSADIFLDNGKVKTVFKCLKYMEGRLKWKMFFRVHKSYIVNMEFVERCREYKKGYILTLKNDEEIPVAKRRKGEFEEKLNLFPAIKQV